MIETKVKGGTATLDAELNGNGYLVGVVVGGQTSFAGAGLDDRQARRLLLDNGVSPTRCDDMFHEADLERAIALKKECVVYDIATDLAKSEPMPYEEAVRVHAAMMAARGDDGSVRVEPWSDNLPGWSEEADSAAGRAEAAAKRRTVYPETYAS